MPPYVVSFQPVFTTILLSAIGGAIIGIVLFVALANWWVNHPHKNQGVVFDGSVRPKGELGIKVIRGNKV